MLSLADRIYAAAVKPDHMVVPVVGFGPRRRLAGDLRDLLRGAERLAIDAEVTRAATTLGIQHPDILMAVLRRARAPFARVWLEWPLAAQLAAAGLPAPSDPDRRIGALVERLDAAEPQFRLTVIGLTDDAARAPKVVVGPLSVLYTLNTPLPERPALLARVAGDAKLPMDYLSRALIGSAYVGIADVTDDAEVVHYRIQQCDRLAAHASWTLSPLQEPLFRRAFAAHPDTADGLRESLRACLIEEAGTWRMVIALFALINSPTYTDTQVQRRAGSRLAHGRIVPFLSHRTITLRLPVQRLVPSMVRDLRDSLPQPLRTITGHIRQSHRRGDAACDHVYVQETPTRDRCALCGHAVWWVRDYTRGSPTLGSVVADRQIVAR